ncbi:MAG: UDP-N-acetylmuramate--L-alanine ligase [Treponema sp.]|nr:UDP-N-acetylmuramate--L-alanine ligase [Treponema sp.]
MSELTNQNVPNLPDDLNGVHIHFVGIKGTGMAALVEIFVHNGAIITGSDVAERFYTDEILEKLGIKPLEFSADNITDDIQYVVYSSAYKLDVNPDLIEATKRKLPCLLYTQALGSYSNLSYSCGVCGVHGKTSTTGLVGTILKHIDDIPSQILAGSVINSFGGTCTYTSPLIPTVAPQDKKTKSIFVAETCEYQRHFMSFFPKKIILTSVEPDHEDYYPTYEDIRDAFVDYICRLPMFGELIYCADDAGAVETALLAYNKRPDLHLVAYGEAAGGDYKLSFGQVKNERNEFTLGIFDKTLALKVPGKHEVKDAAAAVALVCQLIRYFGKHPADYAQKIAQGLLEFSGGKRRSEIVRHFTTPLGNDVLVLDDYGHHPTAIKTTLEGYRQFYSGRKIILDFMSHTYSRTQALLEEFAASMDTADVVILHKIYSSARENAADFTITGRTLYDKTVEHQRAAGTTASRHNAIYYTEEILDAKSIAQMELEKKLPPEYPDGYLFVTMGAGDNWKLGRALYD